MARGERAPLLARGEDVERGLRDDDAANGAADASKGAREGREGRGRTRTTALALGGCAALASVAAISSEADALGGDAGDDRGVADARDGASMHTVFSTECNGYFDWQSYGLYDS